MGLFGGNSKKSTSTQNTENLTSVANIDTADNKGINDITAIGTIKGGTINIQKTDYGAIDAASSIADKALASVDRVVDSSLASVKASQSALVDVASKAQETAQKAAESDTTETIKVLVIGLAAVGIVWGLAQTKLFG